MTARLLACALLLATPATAETVLGPQGVAPPGVLVPPVPPRGAA